MQINQETRLGRMLDAGRLTATVTSKRTGNHLTVTFKTISRDENGRWQVVPFGDGLTVVNEGKGAFGSEKVARVQAGRLSRTTRSRELWYAAEAVWEAAINGDAIEDDEGNEIHDRERHTVRSMSLCGRCGRELTDPESIKRGIGPECIKKATKSKSARAQALAEVGA